MQQMRIEAFNIEASRPQFGLDRRVLLDISSGVTPVPNKAPSLGFFDNRFDFGLRIANAQRQRYTKICQIIAQRSKRMVKPPERCPAQRALGMLIKDVHRQYWCTRRGGGRECWIIINP
jgi:hypothetical protein